MLRSLTPIALLVAVACQSARAADRHVVVITIDGLPTYYLNDPHASLPAIRGLMKSGVAATRGMTVSNPSVTWPNHTTLMTGVHPERHGVLFNGVLERQGRGTPPKVNPAKTQQDLVRVPLLFDVLKAAGLNSAAINWPCTRGSTTIEDNMPDVPNDLRYTTPRLKDELSESGFLPRFEGGGGVVRDEVWTEAARQVILRRKPRLLALHLLNLDSTHHRNGPKSAAGYTAAALTDALVGRVLDALDEAKIRENTTVIVTADHGFAAVTNALHPNAILRKEGLITLDGAKVTSARVYVVPEGGTGMVYFTDPSTADKDRETFLRLFTGAEGVAAIIEPKDFARYHLPQPADNPGMADLVIAVKDGYSVSAAATGDALVVPNVVTTGSHGYLSTEPKKMNAIFVASGAGIKASSKIETLDNADVAPTVARLLGVPLEQATGRVLTEILDARD